MPHVKAQSFKLSFSQNTPRYFPKSYALFRNTLRPDGGGASAATFFPTARTPISGFLLAPAVAPFFVFFTIVVVFDALEILLVLLAFRISSGSGFCTGAAAPRFARTVPAFFTVVGLVALRPVPALGRPGLGFSLTKTARLAVAAAAAALAGDAVLIGENCFKGDSGWERYDF